MQKLISVQQQKNTIYLDSQKLDELSSEYVTVYGELRKPLELFSDGKIAFTLDNKKENIAQITMNVPKDIPEEKIEELASKINAAYGWLAVPESLEGLGDWYKNFLIATYLKTVLFYIFSVTQESSINPKGVETKVNDNAIALLTGAPFFATISVTKKGSKKKPKPKKNTKSRKKEKKNVSKK